MCMCVCVCCCMCVYACLRACEQAVRDLVGNGLSGEALQQNLLIKHQSNQKTNSLSWPKNLLTSARINMGIGGHGAGNQGGGFPSRGHQVIATEVGRAQVPVSNLITSLSSLMSSQALRSCILLSLVLTCDYYICPGTLTLASACLSRSSWQL